MRKIPLTIVNEIISLSSRGLSFRKIGEKVGLRISTIGLYLKLANIQNAENKGGAPEKLAPEPKHS